MSNHNKDKYPVIHVVLQEEQWEIRFTRENLGVDTWAICLHPERVIIIDPDIKGLELITTVLHELIHAAVPDLNEDATLRLESVFAQILQKGPWLRKKWTQWYDQTKTLG